MLIRLQSLSLDTSILPIDVLSFYDDNIYQIVEKIAGPAEAKLLEAQGIRSIYSFLNTDGVFDILSISYAALKEIRKLFFFEADDETFTVKPTVVIVATFYICVNFFIKNMKNI